jgi:hypothetical protein
MPSWFDVIQRLYIALVILLSIAVFAGSLSNWGLLPSAVLTTTFLIISAIGGWIFFERR